MQGSIAFAWLLTFLLHSTLLLASAALITERLKSRRSQEQIWKACLLGSLVTAAGQLALGIQPLGGRIALQAASSEAAFVEEVQSEIEPAAQERALLLARIQDPLRHSATRRRAVSSPQGRAESPRPEPTPFPGSSARIESGTTMGEALEEVEESTRRRSFAPSLFAWSLSGLWGLGFVVALATFALGCWQLRRQLRGRTRIDSGPLREALDRLEDEAGLRRKVTLYRSERLTSPLATGLVSLRICVPARCDQQSPAAQRVMLAHELAHLLRRDPLWMSLAQAMEKIFFVQPLLRVARRQLAEIAEFQCDAWAVRHTGERIALAECLTEVAGWVQADRTPLPACGMAHPRSPLARRVQHILTTPEEAERRSVGTVAAATALVGGALLVAPSVGQSNDRTMDEDVRSNDSFEAPTEVPIEANEEEEIEELLPTEERRAVAKLREPSDPRLELRTVLARMQTMQPLLDGLQEELELLRQLAQSRSGESAATARIASVQRRLEGLLNRRDRVLTAAARLIEMTGSASAAPLPETTRD